MKNLLFPSVAIAALVLAGMCFAQPDNETKNNKPACNQCVQDTGGSCSKTAESTCCSKDSKASCCSKDSESTCSNNAQVTRSNAGATCSSGCCSVENSPVILALDLDKDGVISALEIKNAVSSLTALDSDGDGKLSSGEIHAKSNFSQVNAPVTSKLQLGVTTDYYIERMMFQFDENNNNQLERSEMPESMISVLDRIDTNQDDVMTEEELRAIPELFSPPPITNGGRRPLPAAQQRRQR